MNRRTVRTCSGVNASCGFGFGCCWQLPKGDRISSYDDFLQRLGESEGVRYGEAEAHARAVMSVIREVIGEVEMQKVRRQFPGEFAPLFVEAE